MGIERGPKRESQLSRIWADQRLPGELRLIDGRRVHVVYRGVWSNSDGPDFKDALVAIDGRLVRGAVELHLRASDWYRHRHDGDEAYNDVVLHAVFDNDLATAAASRNGAALPTLELRGLIDLRHASEAERSQRIIATLGRRTCLPTTGKDAPELVRSALRDRGWKRLVEKQLRFSQDLQVLTAPEALYRGLLDALGYSANRVAMAEVGQRMPLELLRHANRHAGHAGVLGALLGTAGFLPLAPAAHQMTATTIPAKEIEDRWKSLGAAFAVTPLAASRWTLKRVRPPNHPVARLASLAALIGASGDVQMFEQFIGLPLDGGKSWDRWLATADPAIGASRRRQIIVNILAPLLAAYADVLRDDELAERVAADWEQLPGGVSDRITRRTRRQIVGDIRFPVRLALEEQGLHEIYRSGCSELRCFECPIARLAIEREPWDAAPTD